jgi:hypothetical protein
MGHASPASVAAGTGYYRYRGNQPLKEDAGSEPLPQNRRATAAKRERFAKYTRLRLEGVSKDAAAQQIGVSLSTGRYYEIDFRKQQREAAGQ